MPIGRKPKYYKPAIRLAILASVEAGNYFNVACSAAGVSERAFYKWKSQVAQGEAPARLMHFVQQVKSAEARSEQANISVIREASIKSWQAAAWLEERKHPERWARTDRIITETDGERRVVILMPDNGRTAKPIN